MAIVYRSDIDKVNSYANSVLSKENEETQKLIGKIEDFISESSSTLKGPVWDMEREIFGKYIDVLRKRQQVANSLLSTIKNANAIMENYINSFPRSSIISMEANVVNSAWISQLQAEINKAKANLASLQKDSGNTKGIYYYKALINECESQIAYINKMRSEDARAYAKYDSVASAMASFHAAVNDISNSSTSVSLGTVSSNSSPAYFSTPVQSTPSSSLNYGYTPSSSSSLNYSYTPSSSSSSSIDYNSNNSPVEDTNTYSQDTTVNEPVISKPIYSQTATSSNYTKTETSNFVTDNETVSNNVNNNINNEINSNVDNKDMSSQTDISDAAFFEPTNTNYSENNNTLRNVGLATAGLAVAGAAAYGISNSIKNANKIDDDNENETDSNENDISDFGV